MVGGACFKDMAGGACYQDMVGGGLLPRYGWGACYQDMVGVGACYQDMVVGLVTKIWLIRLGPNYGGTEPLGMFPLFLKRTPDVMAPRLCIVFRRLVRLGIVSPLNGDRPMSPQFRKVHRPPLLPITDQFI